MPVHTCHEELFCFIYVVGVSASARKKLIYVEYIMLSVLLEFHTLIAKNRVL